MLRALTREVSASLPDCALSHQARVPIDVDRARRQHAGYKAALRQCGAVLIELEEQPDLPDAVFVEDTAVVVDEVAVLTCPGVESRRPELASVEAELARHRELRRIALPATLDGGDVMRVERTLYVGWTGRTNDAGIAALGQALAAFGYRVLGLGVTGCLHLKSACSYLGDGFMIANPEWFEADRVEDVKVIEVDPTEPGAANAVRAGDQVILSAAYPRTARRVREHGLSVIEVEVDELHKAEAAVSCMSILFDA